MSVILQDSTQLLTGSNEKVLRLFDLSNMDSGKPLRNIVKIRFSKILDLRTCNKFAGTIRLVTRLFQQDWYSHDITILLQPFVSNVVYNRYVSELLGKPCNKPDFSSRLLQVVNKLLTTFETSSANTSCQRLWNYVRLSTTCWRLVLTEARS